MYRSTIRIIVAVLLFGSAVVQARDGTVVLRVLESDSGAIQGATVRLLDTALGAVTDNDGIAVVRRVPAGRHTVSVRMIGYRPGTIVVNVVGDDDTTRRTIVLASAERSADAIVVTATRRQDQADVRPSVLTITPREAKFRAGAGEDVFRALQGLPGVTSPSDFSSQLVIRGSGPDQNLILMDGIELFNPYRLYGFISLFNPETVSSISLITGGFPAPYSDRLSAVLDVVNRDGIRDSGAVTGKLSMSVTNANLVTEGALPLWKGSYLVSARRTYYDLIAGPLASATGSFDGDVALPNFADLQVRLAVEPWQGHRFIVNGLSSSDNTEFRSAAQREDPDSVGIVDRSFNSVAGLTWQWLASPTFSMRAIASFYENKGATSFASQSGSRSVAGSDLTRDEFIRLQDSLRREGIEVPTLFSVNGNTLFNFRKSSLRTDLLWKPSSAHTIDVGGIIDNVITGAGFEVDIDPRLRARAAANPRSIQIPESFTSEVNFLRGGLYVQDNIRLTNALTIQPGLRFDYFQFTNERYVTPRFGMSYAFDSITTLRAAAGMYVQSPGYEKLFDRQVFLDLTDPAVGSLRSEKAYHMVLGFERMVTDEWQFRAETYLKAFDDLILQAVVPGTTYSVERIPGTDAATREGWSAPVAGIGDSLTARPVNSATGLAYGMEIMLQKVASYGPNTYYGWISYALAWANRYRDGLVIPFNFDRRHTLNVVGGYRFSESFDLSVTFTYGSGFPWTDARGLQPRVVIREDPATGQQRAELDVDWRGVVFDVDRGGLENVNASRLPDYHRLDLRGTTYASWWNLRWSFYLDLINVYNRRNIISRSWRVNRETLELELRESAMFPILPTLGMSVAW